MSTRMQWLAAVSILCASGAHAATSGVQTCSVESCFVNVKITTLADNALQNAPRFAWFISNNRYKNDSSSGAGGGWFSSVPKTGPINPKGTIVFSPAKSTFAAYDSTGNLVTSGRASGGMAFCPDLGTPCRTPIGTFRVYTKGDADCVSRKFPLGEGGAPMPYCMFFHGGYALHGSGYVPNFPASHGCIRVTPAAAEWLHRNFVQVGTVIRVQSY